MKHFRYSFCGMNWVNFLFMSRLAIHLNNEDLNAKYTKWLTRHCVTVRVNELGIAIPHGSGNKSKHQAVVELLMYKNIS